jgi:hypothetical protein
MKPIAKPKALIVRILIPQDAPQATGSCDARSGMALNWEQAIVARPESKDER